MAILSDRDLFDFDGYARRITELETVTTDWAQSTVVWVNRIRASYDSALKELGPLKAGLQSLSLTAPGADQKLEDYLQKISQVGQQVAGSRQSLKTLTDAQQLNGQVVSGLTAKLADLKQRYDSLDPTQKGYEKQQRAILNETRTVTRAIDAQSKSLKVSKTSVDAAEGSLNHLKKQTADLKRSLDTLPNAYDKATGKINEQNRAAVRLNDQYQKNIATLSKVEAGQKVYGRNVGNYPKAQESSGLSDFVAAIPGIGAAVLIADKALQAASVVGDITLQFDSLDSALQVVSNDTVLFAQRQAMLSRISEDLGQDLATVEQTYTLLTASSKGTRLEGEATDKIFESIVGTMGRLKRPSEDVSRALLAVGQMMSKGTIQSEELKGQLAETLPGSFNVAARAIGVTTGKLTEMLKNGEVIASDFLPKFAAELEHTFNPNNERRVEGLGASLARLRNEGVAWVKSLNIGDSAGAFISNITGMARSVREFFSSAVEQSTRRLDEQTEAVARLEAQLPALLTRYDELKSKTKLSADEQKELQSVVNSLVSLAPSAATGFDQYGNALDVNKGKVLSFAAAQRELNAELNKQALKDLQTQTESGMQRAAQTQATLNRGTEQKSFNFTPYFMRSDEEKRQATDKNAGKRREVALSDGKKLDLQSSLKEENRQIELGIMQRLQLGGKLTQADEKFIDGNVSSKLKQYKVVVDYGNKIADLELKQGDLLLKGDKDSLKKREGVLKELADFKKKRQELLSPTLAPTAGAEDDPAAGKRAKAAEAARKKAQAEVDRQLRDSLSRSEATSQRELAILNDQHQDGLLDEQTYIERRLQVTLAGLNSRQAMLEKAGQRESDDYQKVLEAKVKADTEYNRSQLKRDLQTSKGRTANALASLDVRKSEGDIPEVEYVDRRHSLIVTGIEEEQTILREAGQVEAELYRKLNTALLDEQADYHQRRLKALKKSWKDELDNTVEGLKSIDQATAKGLDDELNNINQRYTEKTGTVEVDIASGKLNPSEGAAKLHDLRMAQIKEELQAIEKAYAKDEELSRALIDAKIEQLENYRAYAMLTPAEIEAVQNQIRELEKKRDEDLVQNKIDLDNKAAKNGIDKSNEEKEAKVRNAAELHEQQRRLVDTAFEFAQTSADGLFSIEEQKTQNQLAELSKRRDYELTLAGDNADAKAAIEKRYDEETRKLKQRQDRQNRAQALFNIGISTAVAVAKTLAEGGPLGIPLAIAVGALGLAQAAFVLAAPLPAYKIGKRASDAYTGPALAGEAGTELKVSKDGSARLIDRPTLINTKAGDTIYTASQTSALIADWRKREAAHRALQELSLNERTVENLRNGRVNEQAVIHQRAAGAAAPALSEKGMERAMGKALDARPSRVTEIDEDGFHEYLQERNGRTEYLNRRFP